MNHSVVVMMVGDSKFQRLTVHKSQRWLLLLAYLAAAGRERATGGSATQAGRKEPDACFPPIRKQKIANSRTVEAVEAGKGKRAGEEANVGETNQ